MIGGTIITMTPIIAGYFISRFIFRLSVIHSLGALCGGMTSTPGLGALNQLTDSEEGSITYAAAYSRGEFCAAIDFLFVKTKKTYSMW
jgi:putative transport protein